jgi:DNA-binding LacI/PurR family transcriptional regulator
MIGLDDVARRACVSRSTASRVLSGTGPTSASARERVLAAAADLGYAPHPVARMLASGSGTRIVLAIRDGRASARSDPFFARVTAVVAAEADTAGLGVALRWVPLDCAGTLAELAADRSVAALLLIGHSRRVLDSLPPALTGRTAVIGLGFDRVPSADVDSPAGFRALLNHLHRQGRRRVVLLGGPRWLAASQAPIEVYGQFARAANVPPRVISGNVTRSRGRAAARRILHDWPDTDAIVAITDALALGVLDELRSQGIRVPDDIAVTGFDDTPLAATARLTSATHPVEQIAAAATTAALTGSAGAHIFPSRPVLRQTA